MLANVQVEPLSQQAVLELDQPTEFVRLVLQLQIVLEVSLVQAQQQVDAVLVLQD